MKEIDEFEKFRNKLVEMLVLEYEYETDRTLESNFIDSASLYDIESQNYDMNGDNEDELRYRPNIPINSAKQFKSQKFSKHYLQKFDDGRLLLKTNGIIYKNIIDFLNQAAKIWNIESILDAFDWKEFESLIKDILYEIGYKSIRTFRYSVPGRRYEVDIVAKYLDVLLFIDGKHWRSNNPGSLTLNKIAQEQKDRVNAFVQDRNAAGKLFERMGIDFKDYKNKPLKVYPVIVLSYYEPEIRWVDSIPIVPISTLNHFVNDFNVYKTNFYYALLKTATIQTKLPVNKGKK